jgi:putative membrane protein
MVAYAASLSGADRQFMVMAAKTDMVEAHEGQMAENQTNQSNVKEFAKTLVQDHTESYQHLTELAAKTGVAIPKGIDVAKNGNVEQLVHLKGARFDRQFAQDEIQDHRQALAAFRRAAAHGRDAGVKAYASRIDSGSGEASPSRGGIRQARQE